MTNAESDPPARQQRLCNKPAAALNILRETVLGRELFDFAFKEYADRWKFKRPTPADFFRTMEDASGVRTSTGSGAAGSTPPTMWMWPSATSANIACRPRTRTLKAPCDVSVRI